MRYSWLALTILVLAAAATADSLYSPQVAREGTLISFRSRKFEVGDIITVKVNETISAQTQSNTNTKKESEIQSEAAAGENPFLVNNTPGGLNIMPEERLPIWHIGAENEHKATGNTKRANTLVTSVTCTVLEVHESGNLRIEGSRVVSVNREDSRLFVSGIIRARDVSPANTIASEKIGGDAVIELRGRGPLWNNQRRGLFTRLLDWFSPF